MLGFFIGNLRTIPFIHNKTEGTTVRDDALVLFLCVTQPHLPTASRTFHMTWHQCRRHYYYCRRMIGRAGHTRFETPILPGHCPARPRTPRRMVGDRRHRRRLGRRTHPSHVVVATLGSVRHPPISVCIKGDDAPPPGLTRWHIPVFVPVFGGRNLGHDSCSGRIPAESGRNISDVPPFPRAGTLLQSGPESVPVLLDRNPAYVHA